MSQHTIANFLVIDASRLIRHLFSDRLSRMGNQVFFAKDVAEALVQLQANQIDIVMVAADLPHLSGLDLMLWLRETYPAIRVVILSSNPSQELIDYVNRFGAYYMHKNTSKIDDIEKLARILIQNILLSNYGMHFTAKSLHLLDVIQLVSMANKTCGLYLSDAMSQQEGLICFDKGHIYHAIYGNELGTSALQKILTLEQGRFKDIPITHAMPSIPKPSDNLVSHTLKHSSAPPQQAQNHLGDIQILFIEDDVILASILQKHLNYSGFNVDIVHSAEDAMNKVENKKYHLIITDFNLPNMSGLEFILWLQKHGSGAKLGLMTSSLSPELQLFLQANGVVHFFQKPLNLDQLQSFIQYIFSRHLFAGEINNLNLQHIFQVLSRLQQPILLHLLDLSSNDSGQIFLNQGMIESISFQDQSGEQALKSILSLQEGLVVQTAYRTPRHKDPAFPVNKIMLQMQHSLAHFYQTLPQPTSGIGEPISADPEKIRALLS